MQTVFFTLCSNNYLAHAKTLGDSLKQSNPDVHFIIGLVDKKHPEIDYDFFKPFEILGFDEIGDPSFDEMISIYDIIEFNTAVKPFYFLYLFKRYGKECVVYYSDPDIIFFNRIDCLNDLMLTNNILITPHLIEVKEKVSLVELSLLSKGIFNLGFIGVKNTEESVRFLNWWKERLKKYCIIDKMHGLYVDQIWINFVPVMFSNVHILREPAFNMAWWNILERRLIKSEETWYVNNLDNKLVFFHFSGFKPGQMTNVGRIEDPDFKFDMRPDLIDIFIDYSNSLMLNGYEEYKLFKPLIKFSTKKDGMRRRLGKSLKARTNTFIKKYFDV